MEREREREKYRERAIEGEKERGRKRDREKKTESDRGRERERERATAMTVQARLGCRVEHSFMRMTYCVLPAVLQSSFSLVDSSCFTRCPPVLLYPR